MKYIKITLESKILEQIQNYINSIMIIEPKWSLRSGDWNLSVFSIIPILVGAIPSNSLLVSMGFSKLATFFLKSGEEICIISI